VCSGNAIIDDSGACIVDSWNSTVIDGAAHPTPLGIEEPDGNTVQP